MEKLNTAEPDNPCPWPFTDEELIPELPPERFRLDADKPHLNRPMVAVAECLAQACNSADDEEQK